MEASGLHIAAFEPLPPIANVLRINLAANLPQKAEVREEGLGREKVGAVPFTYYPSCPGESTRRPNERLATLTAVAKAADDACAAAEAEFEKKQQRSGLAKHEARARKRPRSDSQVGLGVPGVLGRGGGSHSGADHHGQSDERDGSDSSEGARALLAAYQEIRAQAQAELSAATRSGSSGSPEEEESTSRPTGGIPVVFDCGKALNSRRFRTRARGGRIF